MTVLTFECTVDETNYLIGKAHFAPHRINYVHHRDGKRVEYTNHLKRKDITIAGDIFPHESTPLVTKKGVINKIEFEIYDGVVHFIFYTETDGWEYYELGLSWTPAQLKLFNDNIDIVLGEYNLLPVSITDILVEEEQFH